jgi:hypothetical protein
MCDIDLATRRRSPAPLDEVSARAVDGAKTPLIVLSIVFSAPHGHRIDACGAPDGNQGGHARRRAPMAVRTPELASTRGHDERQQPVDA